jgi:hypothetical protein
LIQVKRPDDLEPIEFEGTIVVTDTIPGSYVIQTASERITVEVTSDTRVVPPSASLTLGALVEVRALEQPDGTLQALWVKIENDDPPEREEAAFEGVIETLPPSVPRSFHGHWTVETDGELVTVLATGNTEIEGDPAVGLSVAVEGVWQNDDFVRAESIEVLE